MSRTHFAAAVLALLPAAAFAAPPDSESPGAAKPARFAPPPARPMPKPTAPDVQPAQFIAPPAGPIVDAPAPAVGLMPGYQYYGRSLQARLWLDQHNCAPYGCPKPLGCGNFFTEMKFIFGSCRQFFGTYDSTVGHGYNTVIRKE